MSHPYQDCIQLIPIVGVVCGPTLLYATDDANGFSSHVAENEEGDIHCRGIKLQCISDQLVISLAIFCSDITEPWPQEIVILLGPDGHFISDAVNSNLEVIEVQQVIGSVGLCHWHAVACSHQLLLSGDQDVLQPLLICWLVQWF